MAVLSAHALLDLWAYGRGLHPVDQALAILAVSEPDVPAAEHAGLSLGERDARLIALREALFGPRLAGLASCPGCRERVEFTLDTPGFGMNPGPEPPETWCEVACDGERLRIRPLTSADLAAIAGCADPDQARALLATRCLLDRPRQGTLPPEIIDEVAVCLAACDPHAEMLLDMVCPDCAHSWQVVFDIATYLWSELAAEARRLLQEVDALARRYGWREAEILAMGSVRRRLYLEMAS